MWRFEHKAKSLGYHMIAGVDEAGRGPLAGPVVSAAVILPHDFSVQGINDSKKLSEKKRAALYPKIMENAVAVGTGLASHDEIDSLNILRASLLSMKRAVENLSEVSGLPFPDFLLIDGQFTLDLSIPQSAVIQGDSKSISIAAASVIAKVMRDAIMNDLHSQYPQYGFIRHKGYPTKEHKQAILDHGPSPVHRLTFKGVKEVVRDD